MRKCCASTLSRSCMLNTNIGLKAGNCDGLYQVTSCLGCMWNVICIGAPMVMSKSASVLSMSKLLYAGSSQGVDETAQPKSTPAASAGVVPAVVLGGAFVIFAAAGGLAFALRRSRQQQYELLSSGELSAESNTSQQSSQTSTGV